MLNETQNILNRLVAADREHQKEAGGELLLRSVKYVCAAVLSVFVLDVVFHLPAGWRLGLLLALIFGVLVLATYAGSSPLSGGTGWSTSRGFWKRAIQRSARA